MTYHCDYFPTLFEKNVGCFESPRIIVMKTANQRTNVEILPVNSRKFGKKSLE